MVKRNNITFLKNKNIDGLVTKFCGQPQWIKESQWPLSRSLDVPMRFICQIDFTDCFIETEYQMMAYVFMTIEDEYVDNTWEWDSGENAVIIQPSGSTTVETQPISDGPIITTGKRRHFSKGKDAAYGVSLNQSIDVPYLNREQLMSLSQGESETYTEKIGGNKLGGSPGFLQGDDMGAGLTNIGTAWNLLLQLDSSQVPFDLEFGDMGTGYVFLSEDLTQGRFVWQSF